MPKKYSAKNLALNLLEDNAKLIDNMPEKLVKRTQIFFVCCCGQNASKSFESVYNGPAKCRKCVQKAATEVCVEMWKHSVFKLSKILAQNVVNVNQKLHRIKIIKDS